MYLLTLNKFTYLLKHTGSYADVIYPRKKCYKFLIPRDYRKESVTKESTMTSDSINRLILKYLGTENRK